MYGILFALSSLSTLAKWNWRYTCENWLGKISHRNSHAFCCVQVLDALERYPAGGPAERLINVLFGVERPSTVAPSTRFGAGGVPSALSRLNDSQRDAVEFALATRDVALLHGPPGNTGCIANGKQSVKHEFLLVFENNAAKCLETLLGTGKTTTVVALVLEAVARGWRCLVCAPSNVAVDGILERLVGEGRNSDGRANGRRRVRVVRMGHPARLLPQASLSATHERSLSGYCVGISWS